MTEPLSPSIARLDVPLPVVEAEMRLHSLLEHPPLGHTPEPQPADWYERVFDDLITAHQDRITGGQS